MKSLLKNSRGPTWLALISLCAVALTVPACAQLKPGNAAGANPIIRDKFTADPAPLVVGDTLYLYTGHDQASDKEMFTERGVRPAAIFSVWVRLRPLG